MDRQAFTVFLTVKKCSAPRTIANKLCLLGKLESFLKGRELTPELARDWVYGLISSGMDNGTVNNYINLLASLRDFLESQDIHMDLFKHIERLAYEEKEPRILTYEEVQLLLNCADPLLDSKPRVSYLTHEVFNMSMDFLFSVGCRQNEMLSLKKKNIIFGERSWALFRNSKEFKVKNRLDRRVPIPPELAQKIQEHLKDKADEDYVFSMNHGGKISQTAYYKRLKLYVKKVGLEKTNVHTHSFRHGYIMEHRIEGTAIDEVSKLVGHKNINQTAAYAKYDTEMLYRAGMRHRSFSASVPPGDVLKDFIKYVEKHPIFSDDRFRRLTEMIRHLMRLKIDNWLRLQSGVTS